MTSIGPAVTREQSPAFRRNSRKTTWFPRHRKMKPFPATASQEKSHVRNWRWKRYLAPLRRPHKVPRHPGLPREEHRGFPAPLPLSPFYPPVQIRRVEGAQRKWCGKTSVFLLRETGMSGHFVGRIKGAKYRFDLQYLTWDFS